MAARHWVMILLTALLVSRAVLASEPTGELQARFDAARVLLAEQRFAEARSALRPLAAAGHLQSQSALAAMVLKGLGGARSLPAAMGWYCRLAQQPSGGREVAHALWFLAEYFRTGGAVPGSGYLDGDPSAENPIKALFWFRILAAQERFYEQVVSEGVRIGRLGAANVSRQLYDAEITQIELRLADWRPDPDLADGERCLALP